MKFVYGGREKLEIFFRVSVEAVRTVKMRRVLAVAAGASALLSADAFMTAPTGAGLRPTLRVAARPVSSLGDA